MRSFTVHNNGVVLELLDKGRPSTVSSARQTVELNGADVLSVVVRSAVGIDFVIGCWTVCFGRRYTMNRLPQVRKLEKRLFEYTLEFEGVQYDLMRVTYDLTIDTTNNVLQDVRADSLTGNLWRFATVLVANANRVFPGVWALGLCPSTIEDKTLTFGESDNCLTVLQGLCSEFDVEFEIGVELQIPPNGWVYTINFRDKVGQLFPVLFEFGKGKGLYTLTRGNVDSSNIVTRLKVYGSTQNITYKYRAGRLCLPGKSKGGSYIEKSGPVGLYGVYEAVKYFDDIKPTFDGVVTGIDSGDVLKFTDSGMFDLNLEDSSGTVYLLNGTTAKVHFNTGNLAGYEFEVGAYDHGTHTFRLVEMEDDRGERFPSATSGAFQIVVGDKYKIFDVALPQQYVDAAEARLATEGDTYYDQNSQPKVEYGLTISKDYLRSTFVGDGTVVNIFAVGDYISIKDDGIGVDKSVRIQSFERNLMDEYDYSLKISDTVSGSILNRIISDLIDLEKVIVVNDIKDSARARANWKASRELLDMVFDPEGYYFTDRIRPEAIETMMLAVGAKSMQFGLVGTVFEPNYLGDKNRIVVTGGSLVHYTIDDGGERIWTLANIPGPEGVTFLSDSQAYYIYAKCDRNGSGGTIIFSTDTIRWDDDAAWYHFWIGIVNSVDAGLQARSVALTYGFTTVNGRFIRTGRIQSYDGGTYFDLDTGVISGNISIQAGSTGYANLTDAPNVTYLIETALNDLMDVLETVFADGIISEAEAGYIRMYLTILANENAQILAEYTVLYNNPRLTDPAKINLYDAKTVLLDVAYPVLVYWINTAIADGIVTQQEKDDIAFYYDDYREQLARYSKAYEEARASIEGYIVSQSVSYSEFNVFSDKIEGKVNTLRYDVDDNGDRLTLLTAEFGLYSDNIAATVKSLQEDVADNGGRIMILETSGFLIEANAMFMFASKEFENGEKIMNTINLDTSGVTIAANKINLLGQVTFQMLHQSAKDIIDGKLDGTVQGNIITNDLLVAINGRTIITGGFIDTKLIRTDLIIANGAKIGNFTISGGWLTCNDNLGTNIGYIVMNGTNTQIAFGRDLSNAIPGSMTTCTARIVNNNQGPATGATIALYLEAKGVTGLDIDPYVRSVALWANGGAIIKGACSFVKETYTLDGWGDTNDASALLFFDTFVFQPQSPRNIDLPSYAAMNNTFGLFKTGFNVSDKGLVRITLFCTRWSASYINVRSLDTVNAPLINNNGATISGQVVGIGEVIELGFHNKAWYILNLHT